MEFYSLIVFKRVSWGKRSVPLFLAFDDLVKNKKFNFFNLKLYIYCFDMIVLKIILKILF
jgi:hypothetical protein